MPKEPTKSVHGQTTPPIKVTKAGYGMIATYLIAPVLGLLLVLDIAGYLIAKYVLDACYGILCFL